MIPMILSLFTVSCVILFINKLFTYRHCSSPFGEQCLIWCWKICDWQIPLAKVISINIEITFVIIIVLNLLTFSLFLSRLIYFKYLYIHIKKATKRIQIYICKRKKEWSSYLVEICWVLFLHIIWTQYILRFI